MNIPEPPPIGEPSIARFYRELVDVLRQRLPVTGTVIFNAATSAPVTFTNELPNTNYRVLIEPTENNTFWVTSKATTGFTLNAASSASTTIGWATIRD